MSYKKSKHGLTGYSPFIEGEGSLNSHLEKLYTKAIKKGLSLEELNDLESLVSNLKYLPHTCGLDEIKGEFSKSLYNSLKEEVRRDKILSENYYKQDVLKSLYPAFCIKFKDDLFKDTIFKSHTQAFFCDISPLNNNSESIVGGLYDGAGVAGLIKNGGVVKEVHNCNYKEGSELNLGNNGKILYLKNSLIFCNGNAIVGRKKICASPDKPYLVEADKNGKFKLYEINKNS